MAPRKTPSLYSKMHQVKRGTAAPPTSAALSFALTMNMVTKEEAEGIRLGDAEIQGQWLFLANMRSSCGKLSGEYVRLYNDRATQILIDKLLDEDPT